MVPRIVWSGDENYISRPVCESATSKCKYHGVGIYVCYMPTRFVGRREVGNAAVNFPDLTAIPELGACERNVCTIHTSRRGAGGSAPVVEWGGIELHPK